MRDEAPSPKNAILDSSLFCAWPTSHKTVCSERPTSDSISHSPHPRTVAALLLRRDKGSRPLKPLRHSTYAFLMTLSTSVADRLAEPRP
jgi:hypothetical protein